MISQSNWTVKHPSNRISGSRSLRAGIPGPRALAAPATSLRAFRRFAQGPRATAANRAGGDYVYPDSRSPAAALLEVYDGDVGRGRRVTRAPVALPA